MKKLYIKKDINFLCIVSIIAANLYVSKTINFLVLIFWLLYYIKQNCFKLYLRLPGIHFYSYFLLTGAICGIINLGAEGHSIYSLLKHLYYFINPFLYAEIGYMLSKKNKAFDKSLNDLTQAIMIVTIADLIWSITRLLNGGFTTLHQMRNLIGGGSIFPVIGLFALLLYKKDIAFSGTKYVVCAFICASDLLIHFSRTFLLELLILLLFSGIIKDIKKFTKFILMTLIAVLVASIIAPQLTCSFLEKIIGSIVEINGSTSSWNYVTINNNWRGYELYCEMQRFAESSLFEQLFGGGFGTTLDALGYAYLVSNESRLIFIHNGYGNILMVWGVAGIIAYIGWLGSLYYKAKLALDYRNRNFLRGLAIIIAVVTGFIMGPFFSEGVAMYMFIYSLFLRNPSIYN